ncbi:MAG: hypothetical protein EOO59_10870, partial [Hymenobacter sp.]
MTNSCVARLRKVLLAGLSMLALVAQAQPARLLTTVRTLAGTARQRGSADGPGASARFNSPHSVAVGADGTLYVADMDNHTIRKISPAGLVSTLAGAAGQRGSADGPGSQARFKSPAGLVLAPDGTLYVADAGNSTIRKITPAGVVSTVAGAAGRKGTADGTGAAASFTFPHGLALAPGGTLLIADTYAHTIRQFSPAGLVTTLAGQPGRKGAADGLGTAARFSYPSGVAVDAQGNVYVADNGNNTVRKLAPGGAVTTLAGQPGHRGAADGRGPAASFRVPGSLAAGADGTVYVADYFNATIRQLSPAGEVRTLAGSPKVWVSWDGPLAEA